MNKSNSIITPDGKSPLTSDSDQVAKKQIRIKARWLSLLIIIGLIAAVLLVVYEHQNKTEPSSSPFVYTYKKVDAYAYRAGTSDHNGVRFNKPVEFQLAGSSGGGPVFISKQTPESMPIGVIALTSISLTADEIAKKPAYIKALNQKATPTLDYVHTAKAVVDFTKGWFPLVNPSYRVGLDTAEPIKIANVKDNTWQFNLSATDQTNAKVPKLHGKAIYAFGAKDVYIFDIVSYTENWNSPDNQKVWQQVLNSIKIDQ